MMNKLVANVVVNIILLIIYIYFFGQHSFKKYFEHGIIVVKYEEKSTNEISPPGGFSSSVYHVYQSQINAILAILLMSKGPELENYKMYPSTFCENTTGQHFIQCIEDGAFLTNDIILDMDNVTVTPIYLSDNVGLLSHILQIDPGVITKDFMTSFKLKLNSSIKYQLSIVGHNLQFLFASPTIPRSFLKPPPGPGIYAFYMKVNYCFVFYSLWAYA